MNHVVCVKWGNKYIPQYVNVLYNMIKRHTTVPYQFHCITESPQGLDKHINTIALPNHPWVKTWWSKVWMFSEEFPLKGNILFLDLDVIVHNNIDELFNYNPNKFMIIRDFNRCRVKDWKQSNSSCMRWTAGSMNFLYTDFVANHRNIIQRHWGDQDWVMQRAKDEINHWPDDWIRSYKWEMVGFKDTKLRDKSGKYYFRKAPKIIPENKIAVFHGEPNPLNCSDQFVVDNWK